MRRQVIIITLLALCIGVTIWVTSMEKVGFMTPFTGGEIWKEAQRHLLMVLLGVLIAITIGVPIRALRGGKYCNPSAAPIVRGVSTLNPKSEGSFIRSSYSLAWQSAHVQQKRLLR